MDTLQVNDLSTFQQVTRFIGPLITNVTIFGFIFNLLFCALFGFWLAKVYMKYGKTLSNRAGFSGNFFLLMMTTMLIITIIQQSLALSLGLVGALSIVRFRAAIKEPEELSYLFLCIAMGLGFGANQRIITIIAFAVIIFIIWWKHNKGETQLQSQQNLYLTVTTNNSEKLNFKNIVNIIKKNCSNYRMKRADETKNIIEVCFLIEFAEERTLNIINSSLRKMDDEVQITFLDSRVQALGTN
jgi:hypothetical protein